MSEKTTRVRLRTKHGRAFFRCGVKLHPEDWTELDVTDEQLKQLEQDSRPMAEGGVLMLERVEKPAPKKPAAASAEK